MKIVCIAKVLAKTHSNTKNTSHPRKSGWDVFFRLDSAIKLPRGTCTESDPARHELRSSQPERKH